MRNKKIADSFLLSYLSLKDEEYQWHQWQWLDSSHWWEKKRNIIKVEKKVPEETSTSCLSTLMIIVWGRLSHRWLGRSKRGCINELLSQKVGVWLSSCAEWCMDCIITVCWTYIYQTTSQKAPKQAQSSSRKNGRERKARGCKKIEDGNDQNNERNLSETIISLLLEGFSYIF